MGKRHRLTLALAGAALLLAPLLLLGEQQRRSDLSRARLAARHEVLAGRSAAHLGELLQRLQGGLARLAAAGDALLAAPQAAGGNLDLLAASAPPGVVASLLLVDAGGEVLARAGAAPTAVPTRLASPRLLAGERLLALGLPAGSGSLVALVSLEGLRDACLPPAEEAAGAILLDDSGTFLLHPDPAQIGRRFTGLGADFRTFSAMARGETGSAPYRGALLAYAPLQVAGARWSLGLPLPAAGEGIPLSLLALGCGLVPALLLLAAAVRALNHCRQLAGATERLGAEGGRALRRAEEAEERCRHLLDHASDAVFFIDPQSGALQEVNRQAEELLGYRAEEIRTLSLSVLFPGWQRRRYLRLVKRVLRDGYGEEGTLSFRRKDGGLFTGAVHARLGKLGEAQVVHGTVRDVSGIVRIEQELRQKNRDLALVNEIAHRAAGSRDLREMLHAILAQVIQTFAADGGGVYLVHDGQSTLKLAAHAGIGEELLKDLEHLPPGIGLAGRVAANGEARTSSDIQRDHRVRSQAARQAGWRGFQAIPLAANEKTVGVLFLFNLQRRALSREELRLLLAIGKQVGTSVEGAQLYEALQWQHRLTKASNRELEASRQQLRESLRQQEEANRTLKRLDQLKSNFLSLASHELRTPLTYVLSSAEYLTQTVAGRLAEDEARLLKAIHLGGKRLHGIVGDLLEVARLESQNLYLGRERVDLPALVEEAGASFRPFMAERELSLTVGPFPQPLPFVGDPDHLRRTIHRLLENAVKFTPDGGGIEVRGELRSTEEVRALEPHLRPFSPSFFHREPAGPFLQMTVRDSGIGIDPEEQVRIFDKFYEVGDIAGHFTSRTAFGGKGVGMGLTLVKGMVEAHGGMVWVESPGTGGEGTGSAFHVLLPLSREPEEALDATA